MATTKKTTKTNTAKKTNDSKATKTNNTKAKKTNNTKKTEESSVVDEFLDTVVGETFTEEDVVKPEEKLEELGVVEEMQEENKESVADVYKKQAFEILKDAVKDDSETVRQIVDNWSPTVVIQDDILYNIDDEPNDEPNGEPNDEPNYEMTGEEAYNLVMGNLHKEVEQMFDERVDKTIEETPQQTQNIVYVNSAMGASWD
jgi:hypothetical protein